MILQAAGPGVEVLVFPHGPNAAAVPFRAELSDLTTVVLVRAVPTPIDPSTRRRSR